MILCPLSEWGNYTVKHGPIAGQEIKCRHLLMVSKWNMSIAIEKQGSLKPNELNYFGSFKSLLPCLSYTVRDLQFAVDNIISALVKRTGKKDAIITIDKPLENLEDLGRWIDNQFNTSYLRAEQPPRVYYRLFAKELGVDANTVTISEGE